MVIWRRDVFHCGEEHHLLILRFYSFHLSFNSHLHAISTIMPAPYSVFLIFSEAVFRTARYTLSSVSFIFQKRMF